MVGGAGYLGSVLCRRLVRSGYGVRVLDAFLYGREPLEELANEPGFEVFQGDTRDTVLLAKAMDGVDAVLHLGEIVGDPACSLDPVETTDVNVTGTRMVADMAKRLGVRRFVYPSSCSVYGATDDTVNERSELHPVSLYARCKIAVEQALLDMRDATFHPVILRFATLHGISPRPRFDLVVNLLTARAYVDGVMSVDGGEQWRPFLHVSDAAAAMILCLELQTDLVSGEIFNVGADEQNFTIRQVAKLVQDRIPESYIGQGGASDARNYRVSFDKIHRQLGFVCRRGVVNGIDEIRNALSAGLIDDYQHPRFSNVRALAETDAARRLARYAFDAPGTRVDIAVGPGVGPGKASLDQSQLVVGETP